MRKSLCFTILIAVLLIIQQFPLQSQSLNGISYQGVARDLSGSLITNQSIALRFSILQGSVTGTVVYQETHSVATNSLGIFTLTIMQGTPTGTFSPLHWNTLASSGAFIKTEMDASGGTSYTDMGTTQLLSVPFALYAETSGSSFGSVNYSGTWDASSNSPALLSSNGTKGFYYVVSNSGSTSLNAVSDWNVGDWAIFNGTTWEKVDNSEAPVEAGDVSYLPAGGISATNVQDALEEVSSSKTDKIIPAVSGNFAGLNSSGNLTDSGKQPSDFLDKTNTAPYTPSAEFHPATKKYVDDQTSALGFVPETRTINGFPLSSDVVLTKSDIGLSNVENTSDIDKPISTAQATALGNKANKVNPATAGNFAGLNASGDLTDSGKSPSDYLDKNNTTVYTPGADYHPATKKYVDDSGASLITSYIHRTDDGVTIYLPPGQTRKRFGIGDQSPDGPLGIKGEPGLDDQMISFKSSNGSQQWNMNLNPTSADVPGLSIDETTATGFNSRLFIEKNTGMVGLGTTNPTQKLHIEDSNTSGTTAIKILNTATAANQGWQLGHLHDALAEKNGAFSIFEETSTGGGILTERLTVRAGGNVGINESLPYATLHVTRPDSDPQSAVDLNLGSGITMFGQSDGKNLVFDNQQIQARTYDPLLSTTVANASTLKLQPLGGDLLIHDASANSEKIIFKSDGRVGIGVLLPAEKLHVEGRIIISDSENVTSGSSITGKIINSASTSGAASTDSRIGLQISTSGLWNPNTTAKNIGLYVSQVSGQTATESNLAAVLNGNVVIGDIAGTQVVGSGGQNVLAIQNGAAPATTAGSSGLSNDGIQIYSVSDAVGTSVFNVKNGNGDVIKLFKAGQLTAGDNSSVNPTTYGSTEADIINNLRTRLNELESRLQSLGLLH